VTIPILEESSPAITPSGEHRLLSSSSSNRPVLIARTHTESVIGRSSPYNIIETSTDMDDDEQDEIIIKETDNTLSPSSSLTSGTDVYMDAVEILSDDTKSGMRIFII
jgi:hypothetical protein